MLADPALDHYRHWLESVRRYRPYLLSEPEEKIVTEKTVSGSSAWSRLHSELLSSLRVTLDGEEVSIETALSRLYRPEREIRQEAAEAMTAALAPGLRTRAYVYNTILLDKSIDDRLRGYPSWISSRNLSNEASDEAVQALVDAVVSRYDVAQRYYRLKARLLGLDRIEHYDRFAPGRRAQRSRRAGTRRGASSSAPTRSSTTEVGEIVDGFFEQSWIDAPVRPDKSTGAFCATTIPGVHPYVLMNYTGERRAILDARARARARAARRALTAARALQRVDDADGRRDRVGLRRGAHVQEAPRVGGRPAPQARPADRADRGRDRDDLPADLA